MSNYWHDELGRFCSKNEMKRAMKRAQMRGDLRTYSQLRSDFKRTKRREEINDLANRLSSERF